MATNTAIERAKLFAILATDNPSSLPVFVESTGEIQLVADGPNAGERQVVSLKSKGTYDLLNFAPISWWQQTSSTAGLVNAVNQSWLSIPDTSLNAPTPTLPPTPDEATHFLVLWEPTATPQLSPAGKARMHFDGASLLLSESGGAYAPLVPPISVDTLTYAATVDLDFSPVLPVYRSLALTGNVTFTGSNLGAGRQVSLRIVGDGTSRTFTFPAGWTFLGALPASIGISKTGVLSLVSYGALETDVVVAYSEQP